MGSYFQKNEIEDFYGKIGKKLVRKLVKTVYQLSGAKFAGFLYRDLYRGGIPSLLLMKAKWKSRFRVYSKPNKEKENSMELIEMSVVMGKNRMIQLPEEEVRVMGLKEGDELCLSYVTDREGGKENQVREFLVENRI